MCRYVAQFIDVTGLFSWVVDSAVWVLTSFSAMRPGYQLAFQWQPVSITRSSVTILSASCQLIPAPVWRVDGGVVLCAMSRFSLSSVRVVFWCLSLMLLSVLCTLLCRPPYGVQTPPGSSWHPSDVDLTQNPSRGCKPPVTQVDTPDVQNQ